MNKSKKILAVTLATAMAFPVLTSTTPYNVFADNVSAQTTNVQVKSPFKDITTNYDYFNIISDMQKQGIINGYPDGTFKPNQTLSRQHAAVLIARALKVNNLELEKTTEFVQPKDLDKTNPYYDEIKMLMEVGLLQTDSNGNINPEKPLTRGEMAKILTVAFDLEVKADYVFDDVKGSEYEDFVKALYSNGVTTGYEDYTFKTDKSLTRAHYAVFMYRAMHLDPNYEAKPIPSAQTTDTVNNVTVKYSDWTRDDIKNNIPRPTGYVAGETEKKDKEELESIIADNGYGYISTFTIEKNSSIYSAPYTFENCLRTSAEHAGTTYEEFVKAINWAIDTGKVYKGETYALYFDYQQGLVVVSAIRNHAR